MGEGGEGGDGAGDTTIDESWEERQRDVVLNNSKNEDENENDKLRWRGRSEGNGREGISRGGSGYEMPGGMPGLNMNMSAFS